MKDTLYILFLFLFILFKMLYSRYMLESFRPRFSFHRQVYQIFCRQTFSRSWRRSVSEDKTGVNTLCISEGLSKVVPGEVVEVPRTDREERGDSCRNGNMPLFHVKMWETWFYHYSSMFKHWGIMWSCYLCKFNHKFRKNTAINLDFLRSQCPGMTSHIEYQRFINHSEHVTYLMLVCSPASTKKVQILLRWSSNWGCRKLPMFGDKISTLW